MLSIIVLQGVKDVSVEPLDLKIGLRVICGAEHVLDAKDLANEPKELPYEFGYIVRKDTDGRPVHKQAMRVERSRDCKCTDGCQKGGFLRHF